MIDVAETIDVPSSAEVVWGVLSDPHTVVRCVPGASLGEQQEDGSFEASLAVKFGPARVAFKTKVALVLDEPAMAGQVTARGKDNQGGTRVRATMAFKVVERGGDAGSTIDIQAKVNISGKLATIIETGASIVVKRMAAEFSERLAAHCGALAAHQ